MIDFIQPADAPRFVPSSSCTIVRTPPINWLEITVYDGNGAPLYSDMALSREALRRAAYDELGALDNYMVLIT